MMRRSIFLSALVLLVLVMGNPALFAGTPASHTVAVSYEPYAVISFAGAEGRNWARLAIDDTGIVTEGRQLLWTTNCEGVRVTVQSNLGIDHQNYVLEVQAVNLSGNGIPSGWVVLGDDSSDLVTGIARETGGCFLEYKAEPREPGNSEPDEHVITYTITE